MQITDRWLHTCYVAYKIVMVANVPSVLSWMQHAPILSEMLVCGQIIQEAFHFHV